MTTKHTPGPWQRIGTFVYALMHAGWRHGEEQFKNRISIQIGVDRDCPIEELEAVAALVQAAPNLFEALQKIASIENNMYGPDWEEIEEARQIARSAISKATGESA